MSATSPILLSSQIAIEQQMGVLANNIANLSTPAYKSQEIDFAQYLSQAGGKSSAMVQTTGTTIDFRQGPLQRTGNTLDLALDGDGFFQVDTPQGTEFTRNGSLQLDATGQLITHEGYPVLNANGQPIVLPPGSGEISIGPDGTISTGRGVVGKISAVTFAQTQSLVAASGGFFLTDQTPQPTTNTRIMQGTVEGSNVQAIIAMTRLMSIARAAGATKDYLSSQAQLEQNAVSQLGKVV